MLPHHPYALQQFPNVDPAHVNPSAPPHVPSVETFTFPMAEAVAVGATGVDAGDRVDVADVVATDTTIAFADEVNEIGDFVEDNFVEDDFAGADLQSPKPTWQSLSQYAEVDPHHPDPEQQFPNDEPLQVKVLDCVPQRPEVLILRAPLRNGRAVMASRRAERIANEDRLNE